MGKPTCFLTRELPEPAMEKLREAVELEMFPEDRPPTQDEILEGVEGKDILLCLLCDTIDAEAMDRSSRLALISNGAVGYNNIDIAAATGRGIPVTNVPGVLTHATADLAWALILAVARRVPEGDRYVRDGKFDGWAPMLMAGAEVHGKTLGVIGAGRIGSEVLRRGKGFQMKLRYHNRSPRPELDVELGARSAGLEELLRESDFVSVHTPLTPDTSGMIGTEELAAMRTTAFFINTARGEVVDEEALVTALRQGTIAGAGLDVYVGEPDVDRRFMEMDNVVVLPHVGSATVKSRTDMSVLSVENIVTLVGGGRPDNLVNPGVWDNRRKLG
jgi:glyoxylate reductase